jgi:hypothetical protein
MRKAMKFNLSHTDTYTIVDQNYLSIEDGGGMACDNCNKVITNIVTVENQDGKRFDIGNDCAKTLTSLHESDIKRSEVKINEFKRFYKKLKELVKYNNQHRSSFIYIEKTGRASLYTAITKAYNGDKFITIKYEGFSIVANKLAETFKKYVWTKQDILNFHPDFENEYHYKNYL